MSFIRFVSFNINSDRRLEWKDDPRFKYTANAFSDLSIKNRFKSIKDFILNLKKQNDISCFALQEVDGEALKLLEQLFKEMNFKTYVEKYCTHKDAYHYILAVDENVIKVKEIEEIYFTESGKPTSDDDRVKWTKEEKLKRQFDQEFEKSAQLAKLIILGKDKDNELLLVNIQAGTSNKHRLLAMEKLCQVTKNINCPLIMAGDFNQFDAAQKKPALYDDQINILTNNGFKWISKELQDKGLKATFYAFPHDVRWLLSQEDIEELSNLEKQEKYDEIREFYINAIKKNNIPLYTVCLDAVFAKNIEKISIKAKPFMWLNDEVVNTSKVDPKIFQQTSLSLFKQKSAKLPASDHAAIETTLKFS